ncbi:MAG: DUF342 domain-containing protein [Deferribacterales bacterium]
MPVATLNTLKPHNDRSLRNMLEHVYGISQDWIVIHFDEKSLATIHIETDMDIDARIAVHISDDGMQAELTMFPAINKGKTLDTNAIERYLTIDKRLNKELLRWDNVRHAEQYFNSGYIVEDILVAEGMPKEDGEDAWIRLHFEIEERRPKELASGSVDYREINHIITAEENQMLISYHPETKGTDGMKVTGEKIPAVKGKKLVIHKGKNVHYDEERQGFIATEGGHVIFQNNRLSVNPIYSVSGDVDYSVGNITFDGTVSVSGDVLSGFSINAKNIIVWGVVRDACLTAKDDITVKTGIKSSGKCVVKAGHEVFAGFIENAEVYADNAINIKYHCLNSKLYCKGFIETHSSDGTISGGEIHAYSFVRARKIGLDQCPVFKIFIGVKHDLQQKLNELMANKDKLEKILKDTDDQIRKLAKMNPDIKKAPKLKSIITSRNLLYNKYQHTDEKIEQLINTSMHPMPYIRADETVYDGAVLVFYGTEKHIGAPTGPAKFVFNKGTGKIEQIEADAQMEESEVIEVSLDE